MDIDRKTTTSLDGQTLYYETTTGEASKPVLFFLHGVGGDLDAWRFVQDGLTAHGFPTIAMDLRGHGHSGHPRSARSYEMDYLIADINHILAAEKQQKVILIGHSFGAVIAYQFALTNPDKIDKLILISPLFSSPSYLRQPMKKKLAQKSIHLLAKLSPKPIGSGHSKYPVGKFHKDYEWTGLVRTILRNSLNNYLLSSKLMIDIDENQALEQLPEKTLIIAGDQDTIALLSETKNAQARIHGSKLEVIAGGNHVVILNNAPEVIQSLLNFSAFL